MNVKYEPTVVELNGILELRTYPGPPNYESVKLGDEPEQCYYFKLVNPIDVFPVPGSNSLINDVVEKNVKVIQLSLRNDSLFGRFKKIGSRKKIKLKGTLFHRHTGHHHAEVLMSVDKIIDQ
jgi:hypothetical protein